VIASPAVDLREGRCVQLVGGRPEDERISLPDPLEAAKRWGARGFSRLHVVDLDAALGRGDNREVVRRILDGVEAEVQVGGGIRDAGAVDGLLDDGARRVVVGTRAVKDPEWLAERAGEHPGRVVLAADVRGERVVVRGWTEEAGYTVDELLERVGELPLAGILCTDVGREGRMEGVDRASVRGVLDAARHPVWISGGIRSMDDLSFLDDAGAAGAVLGMALYTGVLDPDAVAREFGR